MWLSEVVVLVNRSMGWLAIGRDGSSIHLMEGRVVRFTEAVDRSVHVLRFCD